MSDEQKIAQSEVQDAQKRAESFLAEYRELVNKHRFRHMSVLRATQSAIVAELVISQLPDEPRQEESTPAEAVATEPVPESAASAEKPKAE